MANNASSKIINLYQPKERFIIPIKKFHIPKKLFRLFKKNTYTFKINNDECKNILTFLQKCKKNDMLPMILFNTDRNNCIHSFETIYQKLIEISVILIFSLKHTIFL